MDSADISELTRDVVVEAPVGSEPSVYLLTDPAWDPRLHDLAARCVTILELPENWNSYRARQVDPTLVEDALRLVARLVGPGVEMPAVVPTATGHVQLEWHRPEQDLEVEVLGLGHYEVYFRDGDEETEFETVDDLSRLAQLIRSFAA